MRTRFVALDVPSVVRDLLDGAVAPVRVAAPQLRWTDPAGWHVTLAYIGPSRDEDAEVARAAAATGLERARAVPRRVMLTDAGAFRTDVLWVGVGDEPSGAVAAAGAAVQEALAAAGMPVEAREVVPHVTLARGGRRAPVTGSLVARVQEAVAAIALPPWVPRVGVWTSSGAPRGSGYEVEADVPLPD